MKTVIENAETKHWPFQPRDEKGQWIDEPNRLNKDRENNKTTRLNPVSAFGRYVAGSGKTIRIKFSDIDTSKVKPSNFPKIKNLIKTVVSRNITYVKDTMAFQTSGLEAVYLGNITLNIEGYFFMGHNIWRFQGNLSAEPDWYNFNRSTHRGFAAETLTAIGGLSPGKKYEIEIEGSKPIVEIGHLKK